MFICSGDVWWSRDVGHATIVDTVNSHHTMNKPVEHLLLQRIRTTQICERVVLIGWTGRRSENSIFRFDRFRRYRELQRTKSAPEGDEKFSLPERSPLSIVNERSWDKNSQVRFSKLHWCDFVRLFEMRASLASLALIGQTADHVTSSAETPIAPSH